MCSQISFLSLNQACLNNRYCKINIYVLSKTLLSLSFFANSFFTGTEKCLYFSLLSPGFLNFPSDLFDNLNLNHYEKLPEFHSAH